MYGMFAGPKTSKTNDTSLLEAAERATRSAFACAFSTSDEYETALIEERRAEGRYASTTSHVRNWTTFSLIGAAFALIGTWLMLR
jgi:hypothetical protein